MTATACGSYSPSTRSLTRDRDGQPEPAWTLVQTPPASQNGYPACWFSTSTPMAKPNYSFEKRQRELAKKKKQDEKDAKKKAEREAAKAKATPESGPTG